MAGEMLLSMKLVALDEASPKIKAFLDSIKQLEGAFTSINSKFTAFNNAMNKSADSINKASSAATKYAAEVGGISAGSEKSATSSAVLEKTLLALSATLSGLNGKLSATSASFKKVGDSALLAESGIKSASRNMETAGVQAIALTGKMHGLGDSIKGMAALWAAFKIEKGLKESASVAGEFQTQKVMLSAMNLPKGQEAEVIKGAFDDSKAMKFVSALDAIKARMAAIGGLVPVTQDVVNKTVGAALTAANNFKQAGYHGDTRDVVRNLYGISEMRGQTDNPNLVKNNFDMAQRIYTVTGGKVEPKDIETYLRQLGQGAATITDDAIYRAASVIDQEKVSGGAGGADGAGGGASRVGTSMKMLTAYLNGKSMNKKGAAMFEEARMMGPNSSLNDSSTTSVNMQAGSAMGGNLSVEDVMKWVEKATPNIIAYTQRHADQYYKGVSQQDPKAIEAAIQRFITSSGFSVTAAKAMSQAANPRTQARIEEQLPKFKGSDSVAQVNDKLSGTYKQNVENYGKAWEKFGIVIGEKILPVLTPFISGLTKLLDVIGTFATENPMVTQMNVLALAVGSVVLAVRGFMGVMGITKLFSSAMLAMGAESKAGALLTKEAADTTIASAEKVALTGGIFTRLGAVITTAAGVIAKGFMRMIPWVGAILIAWDFTQIIANLEVGGATISAWAVGLADRMITAFANGWARIKSIFHGGTKDVQKEIAANDKELNDRLLANGVGGEKPNFATGKINYHRAAAMLTPKSKADQVRDQMIEDAKSVKLGPEAATGKKKGANAGSSSMFNADFDEKKQQFTLEKDSLARHLREIDALYASGKMSIKDYYDQKISISNNGISSEIDLLQREKLALEQQRGKLSGKTDAGEIGSLTGKISALQTEITIKGRAKQEAQNIAGSDRAKAEADKRYNDLKERLDSGATVTADVAAQAGITSTDQLVSVRKIKDQMAGQVGAGKISARDASGMTTELNRSAAAQVMPELVAARNSASTSGNTDEVKKYDDLIIKAQADMTRLSQGAQEFGSIFAGSLNTFFQAIEKHSNSAHSNIKQLIDAVKGLFMSIAKGITDIVNQRVSQAISGSVLDAMGMGGGKNGGGQGMLGGIGGILGGLLGQGSAASQGAGAAAGSAAGASAGGGGFFSAVGGFFSSMLGGSFASGADYIPRDMIAQIHKGEMIIPSASADKVRAGLSGGGNGGAMNVVNNFSIPGQMNTQSQSQLAASAYQGMVWANMRNA